MVNARIADKYQDINALEQSVAELDQMFLDFALLVEQQGEVLNNIELQVGQAVDHIEDGNKEVHQAIEVQKSVRKKHL
jgi:t-SNARE complex subunit (syntaxin)